MNPAEKKQIVMLRSNYQILSEKLARNEISSDVLLKLSSLTESLCNKNFVLANQIQTVSLIFFPSISFAHLLFALIRIWLIQFGINTKSG